MLLFPAHRETENADEYSIVKTWWGRRSGPATSSPPRETPALILAQCRAQETRARQPGAEFLPDDAIERKSYRPNRRLQTHHELRKESCCFRPARYRATGSAYPIASADRAHQTVRPSTRPAVC